MKTLTLKQIPDSLLKRLRAQAKRERRSLNQEALRLLDEGLSAPRVNFADAYAEWRRLSSPIDSGLSKALRGLRQKGAGRRVRL